MTTAPLHFNISLKQQAADLLGSLARELDPQKPTGTVIEEPEALTGEELVAEYITWVDRTWAEDPERIRAGYARIMLNVTNDATQREATIADTDLVHPSNWVFLDDFIAWLEDTGYYHPATAHELARP